MKGRMLLTAVAVVAAAFAGGVVSQRFVSAPVGAQEQAAQAAPEVRVGSLVLVDAAGAEVGALRVVEGRPQLSFVDGTGNQRLMVGGMDAPMGPGETVWGLATNDEQGRPRLSLMSSGFYSGMAIMGEGDMMSLFMLGVSPWGTNVRISDAGGETRVGLGVDHDGDADVFVRDVFGDDVFRAVGEPRRRGGMQDATALFDAEHIGGWKVCAPADAPAWTLDGDVYSGHGSWAAYEKEYGDLLLECDFLFDGTAEGGIAIRADGTDPQPWLAGYELDIDWAADHQQGHIHMPNVASPEPQQALFDVGVWHTVRIRASGPRMDVWLDSRRALSVEDPTFLRGQVVLEGAEGGVKYRNLRVREIEEERYRDY